MISELRMASDGEEKLLNALQNFKLLLSNDDDDDGYDSITRRINSEYSEKKGYICSVCYGTDSFLFHFYSPVLVSLFHSEYFFFFVTYNGIGINVSSEIIFFIRK